MVFLIGLLDKLIGKKKTVNAAGQSAFIRKEPVFCEDAVSYEHIDREFGNGFLFSPKAMPVKKSEVDFLTSGTRHNIEEKYLGADIVIFESSKYKTVLRLSLSIPTFDSADREYDSWHDLFLLQEHNGIIRGVYCTGGYSVSHIEGYWQVYQYPEPLKKYLQSVI